jgi:hypothetical protein
MGRVCGTLGFTSARSSCLVLPRTLFDHLLWLIPVCRLPPLSLHGLSVLVSNASSLNERDADHRGNWCCPALGVGEVGFRGAYLQATVKLFDTVSCKSGFTPRS